MNNEQKEQANGRNVEEDERIPPTSLLFACSFCSIFDETDPVVLSIKRPPDRRLVLVLKPVAAYELGMAQHGAYVLGVHLGAVLLAARTTSRTSWAVLYVPRPVPSTWSGLGTSCPGALPV